MSSAAERSAQHDGAGRAVKTVTVNDTSVEIDDTTTIAELLSRLGYPDRGIAVALDYSVLPRTDWHEPPPDGARLEIVTAVQGG